MLVAKMRLAESEHNDVNVTPPKRSSRESVTTGSLFPSPSAGGPGGPGPEEGTTSAQFAGFDAPSPNGATDARVIVS